MGGARLEADSATAVGGSAHIGADGARGVGLRAVVDHDGMDRSGRAGRAPDRRYVRQFRLYGDGGHILRDDDSGQSPFRPRRSGRPDPRRDRFVPSGADDQFPHDVLLYRVATLDSAAFHLRHGRRGGCRAAFHHGRALSVLGRFASRAARRAEGDAGCENRDAVRFSCRTSSSICRSAISARSRSAWGLRGCGSGLSSVSAWPRFSTGGAIAG